MTTTAAVKISQDGKSIEVSGALSFATVPTLRDHGNELLKKLANPIFDFRAVTRSDSSALALLAAWARYAHGLGKSSRFINIPSQLMDIARLSRLDKVLSLHPQAEELKNQTDLKD
jgi:phospholipid transport system transporter-binding protein